MENALKLHTEDRIESVRIERLTQNSEQTGIPVEYFDAFNIRIKEDDLEAGGEKLVKKVLSSINKQFRNRLLSLNVEEILSFTNNTQTQGLGSSYIHAELLEFSNIPNEEKEYVAQVMAAIAKIPYNSKNTTAFDAIRQYAPIVINIDRQQFNGRRQKQKGYAFAKLDFLASRHNSSYAVKTLNSEGNYVWKKEKDYRLMINLSMLLAELSLVNALESFAEKNAELYEYAIAESYVKENLQVSFNDVGEEQEKLLRVPRDLDSREQIQSIIKKHHLIDFDASQIWFQANLYYKFEDYLPLNLTKLQVPAIRILTKEFIKTINHVTYKVKMEMENHSDYARAFETKKHINKKTMAAMESSEFLRKYQYVELDNDVNLDEFHKLEKEFSSLCKIIHIPQSKGSFRVKKLGRHKAHGLYVGAPINATLVDLDGISAYIHELGHQIDYTMSSNGRMYSEGLRFKHIISSYKELVLNSLNNLKETDTQKTQMNGKSKYNLSYYFQPTEIFARSFEIYLYEKGIRSSFLKSEAEYKKNIAYPMNASYKKRVLSYFDQIFKGLSPDQDDVQASVTPVSLNKAEQSLTQLSKGNVIAAAVTHDDISAEISLSEDGNGQFSLF